MRKQATIGIRTATGIGKQSVKMTEHPTDEVLTKLTQATTCSGIVEKIFIRMLAILRAPQTEMDMRTTATLIKKRLGCKAGIEIERTRYSSHGLANQTDIIGGT